MPALLRGACVRRAALCRSRVGGARRLRALAFLALARDAQGLAIWHHSNCSYQSTHVKGSGVRRDSPRVAHNRRGNLSYRVCLPSARRMFEGHGLTTHRIAKSPG